jgi:hypothetical protein
MAQIGQTPFLDQCELCGHWIPKKRIAFHKTICIAKYQNYMELAESEAQSTTVTGFQKEKTSWIRRMVDWLISEPSK